MTYNEDNNILTLHVGYVSNGKINLDTAEASLLLIELVKFINKH